MADNFTYHALNRDRGEIRLVRLLASEDPAKYIDCHLEHLPHDADASYEALSYTWGEAANLERILLNGSIFEVTPNLFSALCALRRPDANRILWVDAICINQKDISERNVEVLRMLDIFHQAQRVVVWLGPSSDSSRAAIDHLLYLDASAHAEAAMTRLGKAALHTFMYLVHNLMRGIILLYCMILTIRVIPLSVAFLATAWWGLIPGQNYYIISIVIRLITYWQVFEFGIAIFRLYRRAMPRALNDHLMPDESTTNALRVLFSRSWFYRIWVIQEIAAAKDAIIYYGQDTISWDQLCSACNRMDKLIGMCELKNPYNDTYFRSTRSLRDVAKMKWTQIPSALSPPDLINLLGIFRNCESTDPHDMIYALLGLSGVRHNQLLTEGLFHADYNKPVPQLFAQLVQDLVNHTQRLDVLRLCDGLWKLEGLPSWAPDLTADAFRGAQVITPQATPYTFGLDRSPSEPVARFADDLSTMMVRGFVVGRLSDEGQLIFRGGTLDNPGHFGTYGEYVGPMINFFIFLSRLGILIWVLRGATNMMLRVLAYQHPNIKSAMEPFKSFCNEIFDEMSADSVPQPQDNNDIYFSIANLFPTLMPGQEIFTKKSFEWKSTLSNVTVYPSNCHTYAPHAQKGDLTCMFIGAGEPYLLRKQGGHYVVVGDATFGPFSKPLWRHCENEYRAGRLAVETFELR